MYTALLIDDEADARKVLKGLLELFCPEISTILEASNGTTALETCLSQQVNVAFIDIQLRQENGIEIAQPLLEYCPNIIFVTAHDQYAVEAYKTNALHYLLKPVIPEQLQAAVNRMRTVKPVEQQGSKLLLPTRNGVIVLDQKEIIRVKGDGNYCHFFCSDDQRYFISRNLAHYEALMDEDQFFRIHQSHLVNLSFIRQLSLESGYQVILKNGDELPLAQKRKEGFMQALAKYG